MCFADFEKKTRCDLGHAPPQTCPKDPGSTTAKNGNGQIGLLPRSRTHPKGSTHGWPKGWPKHLPNDWPKGWLKGRPWGSPGFSIVAEMLARMLAFALSCRFNVQSNKPASQQQLCLHCFLSLGHHAIRFGVARFFKLTHRQFELPRSTVAEDGAVSMKKRTRHCRTHVRTYLALISRHTF